MKNILPIFICLFATIVCKAEEYVVKPLNLSNGLSNNYVLHIIEDKYGFLWFSTEEGLNRFDGIRFFVYEKGEDAHSSISSNELSRLLDDPEKPFLWIGTQHDGLNCFDYINNSFTCFRHDDNDPHSLSGNRIADLQAAKGGGIWIAMREGGVDLLEPGSTKFCHYNMQSVSGLPDEQIQCVLDDGQGHLYAGHVNNGLSVIDIKRKTARSFHHSDRLPQSLSSEQVTSLTQDKSGNIWIGTMVGVDVFNAKTGSFIHVTQEKLGAQRVYDLHVFGDGLLWVATERTGIVVIDTKQLMCGAGEDASMCIIKAGGKTGYSLTGNDVRCLYEDRFGNVWAGLWEGGVNFLTTMRPPFFTVGTNTHDGLMDKSVMSLCFDPAGLLWAGTNSFGINVLSPDMKRTETFDGAPGPCVQTVFCDSQGDLWVGGFFNGLYRLSQGRGKSRVLPRGDEDVRVLYEDTKRQMWVATSNGLYVVDRASLAVKEHLMRGELVRAITQDAKGNMWVGTYGKGIRVLSPENKCVREILQTDGLPTHIITHLMCDTKGRIWIATNEGAVCFRDVNDKAPVVYNRSNGLLNSHIRALVEDDDHRIWMSTNKGVSCVCEENGRIQNFSYLDNVPFTNFNDRSVAKASDGTLYFGTAGDGICYFHPRDVIKRQPAPLPHITAVTVFQMENNNIQFLTGQKEIRLSHDENTLGINFHVLNYATEQQVEYSYHIEGLKNDWTLTSDGNVVLHDLPHGSYRFSVRARLRNQEWSAPEILDICIMPPLWLTWWAKLTYWVMAMGLIAYAFRNYRNHLQLKYQLHAEKRNREQETALNEERMRFFTNVTHELRTPITLILGPLSDLSGSLGNMPEGMRHKLAVCYQSAVRLNELINKLLDFRKAETHNRRLRVAKGNIVEVVKEVSLKYEELAQNPNVCIRFHACEPVINIYFDKEIIRTVIDNLMSNAIKYTSQGRIDITVMRQSKDKENRIEISVKDTGYGISKEALPHIFESYYQEHGPHQASGTGIGLALVKKLVDLHQGNISVTSIPAQGTCFTFSLDAGNIYEEALHGEVETADVKETATEKVDGKREAHDRFSILIVEDNRELREYLAESFGKEHEVFVAKDGREGLALAIEQAPDIIVSDVMMPEMDGNQLCKALKSDPRTSHMPIILLTAKDSDESRVEGYDAGADSYITKPFTHTLLLCRMKNLVQSHRRMVADIQSSSDSIEEKQRQLRAAMNKVDQEFFDHLNEIIMENISGDLDINLLTTSLAMSTSKLYKKVKTLTGLSPNEYVRKMKMRYAEQLILKGKYSISEISFMVGMNSVAYFRRCFKAEYGILPSEYKRNLKGENKNHPNSACGFKI